MPAFEITNNCSSTNEDDDVTPSSTPNTSLSEQSPDKRRSPAFFPVPEKTAAPVHIQDLPPAPYFPMMNPYGYPRHPFIGFPYGYGSAMSYPGLSYPPSFGLPPQMTNFPFPAPSYSNINDQKENVSPPIQEYLRLRQHEPLKLGMFPASRERADTCTTTTPRQSPRTSENVSPVPTRTRTSSLSDDTSKLSNISTDSNKNSPSTSSPDSHDIVVKKGRTNYTPKQVRALEKVFMENPYPDIEILEQLTSDLNIPEKKLKNWFQNKRSRNKKKIQENHQIAMTTTPSYFMNSIPPHMMPPFTPFYPMTSPNAMIPSATSPTPMMQQHSPFSYPRASQLSPVPTMLLPSQSYSQLSQQC